MRSLIHGLLKQHSDKHEYPNPGSRTSNCNIILTKFCVLLNTVSKILVVNKLLVLAMPYNITVGIVYQIEQIDILMNTGCIVAVNKIRKHMILRSIKEAEHLKIKIKWFFLFCFL